MNKRKWSTLANSWLLLFVLTATLMSWNGKATAEESFSRPALFDGVWTLLEKRYDCSGKISDLRQIKIKRKDQGASLILFPDAEPIDCQFKNLGLQCSGKIDLADGGYLKLLNATFLYSMQKKLIGNAKWIKYDAENNACQGYSNYLPVPSDLYFDGKWNFTEVIYGCGMEGFEDENTAVITQTGNRATLCANGACFNCNITIDKGLSCNGEFPLEDGSIMDYQNASLQYSEQDNLEGEAQFAISYDGQLKCEGTSRMSATRIASDNSGTKD